MARIFVNQIQTASFTLLFGVVLSLRWRSVEQTSCSKPSHFCLSATRLLTVPVALFGSFPMTVTGFHKVNQFNFLLHRQLSVFPFLGIIHFSRIHAFRLSHNRSSPSSESHLLLCAQQCGECNVYCSLTSICVSKCSIYQVLLHTYGGD
jgi:hypothetical protein